VSVLPAALHADPIVAERLARYVEFLLERNAHVNLTSARDPAAVGEHVRDSLELLPYVRGPLLDVGSGGGFPAIPLALAAGFEITLIESVAKKARFLSEALAELGVTGRVLAERAEIAGRDTQLRAHFASATARAVGSLPTVLELTLPFLEIGGSAVLQRGRLDDAERIAASDAALVLGGGALREIPLGDQRRLIVVLKERVTPGRFPRRPGVPAKRPLCLDGES
jgi:16S rRNA (guanine527-N7)-methyltransferase